VALLSRATIYVLFLNYMSSFFMRNEIFSKDIKNVKISSFLQSLFEIVIISGVTRVGARVET